MPNVWKAVLALFRPRSAGLKPDAAAAFNESLLRRLYEEISDLNGVETGDLKERLRTLFELNRAAGDVQDYREGRNSWKKLRDEVVPVATFLERTGREGRVRFPLDDHPPDAWFWPLDGSPKVGIEVTGALARARGELAKTLREAPIAPGFLGLPDPSPQKAFDHARARGRVVHAPRGIVSDIEAAVRLCMSKKDDPKFAGQILLIIAPLESLPRKYWPELIDRLSGTAAALPFAAVFLQGVGAKAEPVCLSGATSPHPGQPRSPTSDAN